jgi:KaiC/GvpD/RAD55 family RecA-like ATPase
MDKKEETFMRYGKTFQEKLCQLMIEDRSFCDQMEEVLSLEFFELAYLRAMAEIVLTYREERGIHPKYDLLEMKIKGDLDSYDRSVQTQIREFYARVLASQGEISDAGWVKDKAIDFCRKQVLKKAMMESVGLIKTSSFDEIQKVIQKALTLGTDNNFGHDWMKDVEDRFVVKSRKPITTGWPRIDDITKGGFGCRELGVVIAPTGAGKSMILVHLGSEALKLGKTVVHYTLELADTVVGQRYDSCITEVPLQDLNYSKQIVIDKIKDVPGKLIIKEYPTKSASTRTIKNHVEKLKKKGIYPDLILVDYADLLRPVSSSAEKRHELENIYEELRAIAQENDCSVVTASQTNRGGLNAEVITMESISEAFNKCFVADFIFSLSRTPNDKQANKGRIFVAKNRNGPDGIIYHAFVDWSNIKIKLLDDPDDEETKIESTTDTLNRLRQTYAKHKK